MSTKTNIYIASFVLALSLAACGGGSDATPQATTVPAPAQPAATSAPAKPTDAPATAPTAVPATATEATATPESAATATSAPVAPAPAGDAKEDLLAAMRKQISGGPYRLKTTITSDKSTTQMDGEVVPPDQMHMTMGVAGNTTEMIYIGDKGWMKAGDKWVASPIGGGEIMKQVMQSVDEFAAYISNVQYVGEESLDGKPAKAYTYHMELPADKGGVKSDAKVWIDSATGLILKSESNGEFGSVKSTTVQTIEYDPGIKIEPPDTK